MRDVPQAVIVLADRLAQLGWVRDLFVAGSLATGDYVPGVSDLDLVAVVDGPVDSVRLGSLAGLHREVDGGIASGLDLGCVYVDDGSLLDRSALHPMWTHGGLVRRSLSGVTRAELVRHGFAVVGRAPQQVLAPVTDADVRSAARAEICGYMAGVEEVEVVVAHNERATLRVGDVFLKIDADQRRTDVEVEAMAMAPIPTPEVLWRKPPVLALAALPGTALGRLGESSTASAAAWAAAGAAARMLHDAPLPPWPGRSLGEIASELDGECEWLITNGVLPAGLVTRNRRIAEAALRPWTPAFIHGDLQITHVFVDKDEITGVIDWSEASQGDALYDLAILTLGHEEHLGDVVAGYGTDVDPGVIRAWWSLRSLLAARWLIEHGFDPSSPGCEFDVLRSQLEGTSGQTARGLP